MNAYTLLMKVVLDVKQEKEEVKVATLVFSKDDDRDKIANKTKIAPKEVKEIVVDYAVADFDHDWLLISQTTVQKRMRLLNFHSKILRRHL